MSFLFRDGYSDQECPVSCDETDLNDTSTFFMEYVLEDSNAADYFNKHVVGFSFTDDSDNSGDMDTTLWYSNAVSWLHCLLDFLVVVFFFTGF